MNRIGIYLITTCLLTISGPSWSQDLFQDVSDQVGLTWIDGDPYEILDAAWIDFNSDGFPDLWTMPHGPYWDKVAGPQLFINQSGTSFIDNIDSAWPKPVQSDQHGSCWGDFDNDGDPDGFLNQGGGGGNRPYGPKTLLVNEENLFVNRAEELGLSPGPGRGRSGMWLDWNKDGWLDLIMLNKSNNKTDIITPPSKLFAQTDTGFVDVSTEAGFILNPESIYLQDSAFFGIITHLFDDNIPDIVVFDGGPNRPSFLVRVYRNETSTLEDVTNQFPISKEGNDAVVADFNQDAIPDIFIVEGKQISNSMIVHESDKKYILGHFRPDEDEEHGMSFKSADNIVTFDCQSEPTSIFIGAGGISPNSSFFTLSPAVPYVEGLAPRTEPGTYIGYDLATNKWTVLVAAAPYSTSLLSSVTATFSSSKNLSPIDNSICGSHFFNEVFEDDLLFEKFEEDELFTLSSFSRPSQIDVTAQSDFSEVTPINFTPVDIENSSNARFPIYLEYDPTLNQYIDRTAEAGFTRQLMGYTVVAGDFDNDMDQDIYIRQAANSFAPMQSVYYENQGNGTFTEIADAKGATVPILRAGLSIPYDGTVGPVMAVVDYDRNGFLDIFTAAEVRLTHNGYFHVGVPVRLFQNQGNGNRWLQIDLEGTISNRDALGAKVLVHTPDDQIQVRVQDGGSHMGGQNQHRLHFGLGSNTSVDLIEIVWPNGNIQMVTDVDANQIIHIKEKIVEDIILDTEAPRTNGKVLFKPGLEQWESSTQVTGYWGNNYYHDNNQDQGNKEVIYRADFPLMGTYEVFLRWPANNDQASYVEVGVRDKNNTSHLNIVDQTTNGEQWISVGQYVFEVGTRGGHVIIRNRNANGRVIADAVKFVWKGVEPPPSPTEIIMDSDYDDINGKIIFKPDLASWQTSTTVPGFEGLSYYHDQNEAQGTKKIIYRANIPQAGIYEVFLKWTANDSHATNTSVVIRGLYATHSHQVNQTTQGGQWVSLGEYTFAEGTSTGRIIIKNQGADGYVIADAVKFVWKGTE